jgi:HD superfamily phosphohydrolase
MKYLTPDELKDDFDWDLLLQLVISSFSSDYELKAKDTDKKNEDNNDELRDLYIAVKSGDQSVVKTVSELWSFQILRLYEIYIEEQMNLHALMSEDEKEKTAIQAEREMRLKKWEAVLDTLDRGKEADKAKKDQASKLDDLMGKL